MNYYIAVLKKYAEFSGRARRKEYWMFVLFNILISIVLGIIEGVLGLGGEPGTAGPISSIYSLAVLVPSIAVAVRRMHDIGKSGWAVLIALIPFIGWIIAIIWLAKEGEAGENAYGADPKQEPAPVEPAAPAV